MRSHDGGGLAQARLRRAIATGNPTLARATALELPRVELVDALALCLLFRDRDRDRYERAAVRLHGRLCLELSGLGLADAQLALCGLEGLRASEVDAAAAALTGFCEHAWGSLEATDVVSAWLERRQV